MWDVGIDYSTFAVSGKKSGSSKWVCKLAASRIFFPFFPLLRSCSLPKFLTAYD